MRMTAIAAAVFVAAPCFAQTAVVPHTVDVTGHGKVSVPPDTANVHYWLRGEGKTPDDATRRMVDAQRRVESGLKEFLGADVAITNSTLIRRVGDVAFLPAVPAPPLPPPPVQVDMKPRPQEISRSTSA